MSQPTATPSICEPRIQPKRPKMKRRMVGRRIAAKGSWGGGSGAALLCACKPGYRVNPTSFAGTKIDAKALVTIGPSDVFDVRVYGESELSGTFRVSQRGKIRFPLVGLLSVDGKTPTEIEELLR